MKKIKSHPERISNMKPFTEQYHWKKINFPSHTRDWEIFESNNKSVPLNIFDMSYDIEEIKQAYKSKYSFNRENPLILLIITNDKK